MSLRVLTEKMPREQGGARAYRAFDYQIHASMARILEAHTKGEAFSAYFDYLDDLVMVEGEGDSVAISFYQVKARTKSSWTPARLATRPKAGELPKSVIGKAYYNLHQFGLLVHKAAVVSNQHLQATLADGTKTSIETGEIQISELCADEKNQLLNAINLDFPGELDARLSDVLCFERIPLDVHSFRQTLLGQVAEFVDALGSGFGVAAKPLYEALFVEISRCTGKVAKPKTLEELQRQKGLNNRDLDALVMLIRARTRTPMEWWSLVQSELEGAKMGAMELMRLYSRCVAYWEARQRGSAAPLALAEKIRAALQRDASITSGAIVDGISACGSALAVTGPVGEAYDLRAAILVEMMESIA